MSERKWRPQYDKPQRAGDVFGDFQVGEAFVVTYHLDGVPDVRVSAYFGVERHQNEGGAQPAEPARYSPVSHVSFERLDHDGEVAEEVVQDNGEVFPLDYTDPGLAMADAEGVANEWQSIEWDVPDFWDGEDLPRG